MKNSTILKDELSLLNADKSAVVTELRKSSQELKDVNNDIMYAEKKLEAVNDDILKTTARLDDLRGRAVSVKSELFECSNDLKNARQSYETFGVKKAQEEKLHLGRIKELGEKEEAILEEIAKLRNLFDRNSDIYAQNASEKLAQLRNYDAEIKSKTTTLTKVSKDLEKAVEEDKKITKDRLKREDKIRTRERHLDLRETAQEKREEDLITMSNDIAIIYGRLKELYFKVDPNVDLDKLILQPK